MTSHHQATKQSSEMANESYASPRYCRAGWSQLAQSRCPGVPREWRQTAAHRLLQRGGQQWQRCFGVMQTAAPIVKEKEVYRDDIDATADTRIAIAMCHFSGSP